MKDHLKQLTDKYLEFSSEADPVTHIYVGRVLYDCMNSFSRFTMFTAEVTSCEHLRPMSALFVNSATDKAMRFVDYASGQ
jgi:hypothetical protein